MLLRTCFPVLLTRALCWAHSNNNCAWACPKEASGQKAEPKPQHAPLPPGSPQHHVKREKACSREKHGVSASFDFSRSLEFSCLLPSSPCCPSLNVLTDVQLAFGLPFYPALEGQFTLEEKGLSLKIMQYFSNFVRSG